MFERAGVPKPLRPLVGGKANVDLIDRNWADILRVAATIGRRDHAVEPPGVPISGTGLSSGLMRLAHGHPREWRYNLSVPRSTTNELLLKAVTQPMRILTVEATEETAFSTERLRCKIMRDDVDDGALALIFAVAALSFHDARPRGSSDIDYLERDEWTPDDLARHLRFTGGTLRLDTDYVRGRMMKTSVTAWPSGIVEIQTINRHQMASRWVGTLMGKKHLRLVSDGTSPPRSRPSSSSEQP